MKKYLLEIQRNYQDSLAPLYRKCDDLAESNPDIQILIEKLSTATSKKEYKNALEIGCGTGRYFHALKNIDKLTGIDPSEKMLIEAKTPFKKESIAASVITLVQSDLMNYLPGTKFDFVYSFGVLGEHIPFDRNSAKHIHTLLQNNGDFYFTVINPFQKPRIFAAQIIKKTLQVLGIGKSWRIMNLTAFGWNTKKGIQKILEEEYFDLVSIETVQENYPHYLVFARKRSISS